MMFFKDFGFSELMLRKVWRSASFINILVWDLLFLMYISVSRNEILSFDISYSNLIDGCFVVNSFKSFSRPVLLLVHVKNSVAVKLITLVARSDIYQLGLKNIWKQTKSRTYTSI